MKWISTIRQRVLAVSDEEATLARRGFDCPNPDLSRHLEQVGFTFLAGYRRALGPGSLAELQGFLEEIDSAYRGFAYEGAAMGLFVSDKISFRSRWEKFNEGYAQPHIYMSHVGAGWALARLPHSLRAAVSRMHPVYRWLAVDGYGFHQAYFHTDRYVHNPRPTKLKRYFSNAFYQGVGRALWFVFGGQPEKIDRAIWSMEGFQGDLWSGVGLAATYAGGGSIEVLSELNARSGSYSAHAAQGAVFGATARHRAGNIQVHNEVACLEFTGLSVGEAAQLADSSFRSLPEAQEMSDPLYEQWRRLIRESLRNQRNRGSLKPQRHEEAPH